MVDLRRHPRLPRQAPGRPRSAASSSGCSAELRGTARRHPGRDPQRPASSTTTTEEQAEAASSTTSPRLSPERAAERRPCPASRTCASGSTACKSTQKITAAMKMVAAAKLRRAQEQAEAARPYAERMERDAAARWPPASPGMPGAPPLLAGTGKDDVHLLVVATADRGLCGGFNTSIVRGARAPHPRAARPRASRSRSSASAARAATSCAATSADLIVEHRRRIVGKRGSSFADAAARSPSAIARAVRGRRVRRLHARLQQASSRRSRQIVDRAAADPGRRCRRPSAGETRRERRRDLRVRAGRGARSWPSCCRATSRSRSSARCWRTRPASRARA